MKKAQWQLLGKTKALGAAAVGLFLGLAAASAQLAITEVLSDGSTTHQGVTVSKGSDWWELTNYGTNWIDLTGYIFTDSGNTPINSDCFSELVIGPRESIIFVRTNALTTNEAEFRKWLGSCLRPEVVVRSYFAPGFDNVVDGVRLYDSASNLVDRVDFGEARNGVTFVSDPEYGYFGVFSRLGVCGTCQAETADDIGSPGTTCGPVPLRILEEPISLTVCGGSDPVFCVRACGLPRPKYEWQSSTNGSDWEPIAGGNSSCLALLDAQPSHEGYYRVVVSNGLERLVSAPAQLTVDTAPSPPLLLTNLSNVGSLCELHRFEGETARFTNVVCAFPRASIQWYSNGVPIVGADTRVLVLKNVRLGMSGTVYSVISHNELGSTNASARLWVDPRPELEITEVMPAPSTNGTCAEHANWFELTNRGTNVVKLKGFRHADRWDLPGAKVVNDDILLLPGESVIFVEGMTREAFVRWWGVDNLPPTFKLITYLGYGLSGWGDPLYVWSAGAESELEVLAGVSWASPTLPPLGPTCPCYCDPELCDHPLFGHSLFFDKDDYCAFDGRVCKENENGAFRAAECDDVGSPGWTQWTPPSLISVHRESDSSGVVVTWKARPGSTNLVQYKQSLADPDWTTLESVAALGASRTITDTSIGIERLRFYRIVCLPNGQASEALMWPPPPRLATIPPPLPDADSLTLTWTTEPPHTYVLQCRTDLGSGVWSNLCTNVATSGSMTVVDTDFRGLTQRFYRVICLLTSP